MSNIFGGGGDSGYRARLNQQAQQENITQGEKAIQNIFSGGTYGTGTPTSQYFAPGQQYYTSSGDPYKFTKDPAYINWTGNTINRGQYLPPGAKFGSDTARNRAAYEDYLIQSGQLFSGKATTPGFNQDFYNNIIQQYTNYAMPQVQNQYQTAANQTQYKLFDQGLGAGSTARDYLTGQLQKTYSDATQQVYNQGLQQSQNVQQQVANQESNLLNQLVTSGNPALATNQAYTTASQFRAPQAFAAIPNLFNTFANTYLASQLSSPTYSNPYLLNPSLYRAPSSAGAIGPSYGITE